MAVVWDFIQNQLLGMRWLNEWIGNMLTAFGLDIAGRIGGSIQFFLYDVLKITVLLCFLILVIGYIQSYFPPERSKKILGRFRGIWANIIAALLGTVTPFCSCSSIPLFIGFSSAGLPLGVTFSFLISSPMVDLGSLLLLSSIFGWKIAVAYVAVGLIVAVAGGTLIEKLHMEKYVESFVTGRRAVELESPALSQRERLGYAKEQMFSTFKKVFPYILVGVGIGAVIHNWIPANWVEAVLGSRNPFGVMLATLIGAPMYADIFGTIPVAEALLSKGAQLGTVLSFMMAVTTLSLPSMIMLKKAIRPKLLALFIGICITGIVIVGYLFNAFQYVFVSVSYTHLGKGTSCSKPSIMESPFLFPPLQGGEENPIRAPRRFLSPLSQRLMGKCRPMRRGATSSASYWVLSRFYNKMGPFVNDRDKILMYTEDIERRKETSFSLRPSASAQQD